VFWNSAVIFELHVSCRQKKRRRKKQKERKGENASRLGGLINPLDGQGIKQAG
jgi:hypothetical protein